MNTPRSTPHAMLSEQRLCWLNSSIQLILSDNMLATIMSEQPFLTSKVNNTKTNQRTIILDTTEDSLSLSESFSKLDESTIRYLCATINSPPTKSLPKTVIQKYIEDLREYGPKLYSLSKNEYLPYIRPIGQLSCVNDYLSDILLGAVSNFIDLRTIWDDSLTCSQCHTDNIIATEHQKLLKLFTSDCKGSSLPGDALESFFLVENTSSSKRCNTCGNASDQNKYCKQLVQLPDILFLSFTENKSTKNDDNNTVKSTEFFIKNHLDMSAFSSPQLVYDPSYFKYQLKSVIINMGDTDDNRHYYTFAKYAEQFYHCNDESIEPVEKSVVFERKYSISSAMYTREKVNNVNFIEIIHQIVFNQEHSTLFASVFNSHMTMMFHVALEYIASYTKALCWSYGAVFTCLECKSGEF